MRGGSHTLAKQLECVGITGLIITFANEVFRRDHKALAVEGELKVGAEFGLGVAFAFLDGTRVEAIKRNQAIGNLALAFEFEFGSLGIV